MSKSSLAAFLEACGASGPLSLQAHSAGTPATACIRLAQPFAVVGRSKRNHVVLSHSETSRRHVYLQLLAGSLFCVDLESRTGTHWPDGPRPAGWLARGQALHVGGHDLRLLTDDSAKVPEPCPAFNPLAAGSLQGPHLTLEFLNGQCRQQHWTMNRALVLLGTAAICKVRFHDTDVAAVHGSLVWTPQATWVVDLRGRAGIYINGQRVRCARLDDGDRMRVGDFDMRVHCPTQPPTLAAFPGTALVVNEAGAQAGSLVSSTVAATFTRSPQPVFDAGELPAKGPLEALLLPLVQQFNAMQNQMFDQFQQATMMMFQMFGNLQKEQMGLIRRELDRVQELTQEIQVLQAELKKPHPSPVRAPARPSNPTPPSRPEISYKSPAPPAQPVAPPQDVKSTDLLGGDQDPLEVHAWLRKRMAELQEDRRSRLQKILGFISGK